MLFTAHRRYNCSSSGTDIFSDLECTESQGQVMWKQVAEDEIKIDVHTAFRDQMNVFFVLW